jgi:hypothetical protein
MTDPIIIVGPGRCGTSCVAGVLHHLGVFVGLRLVGADATNPFGHFEDCEFLQLNAALLRQGLSHAEWAQRVRQLIAKRRALGVPWGWKDPRTCNLLRDYLEFFNDPKFVRCVRPADQIEASVVRAYGDRGWTPDQAYTLRSRREQELDRYLPWYRYIEIDFDRLRQSREETVRSLVQFCGLGTVSAERICSAVEFIRPSPPAA